MDVWEFLARSEWPAVVAGGLFVFREPIKRKLESTVKASGLGMSLEFAAEKGRQAEDDLEKLKADNPQLAEKLGPVLEKVTTANNAVSSALSGIPGRRIFEEHLQDGIKVR